MDNSTLGALVILLIVFLAGRELFTWYTKANLQVSKLNEIIVLLTIIKDNLVQDDS